MSRKARILPEETEENDGESTYIQWLSLVAEIVIEYRPITENC